MLKVYVGRLSTSKDASSTKASVPANIFTKEHGNAESTPGCCNKCFKAIIMKVIVVVFSPPLSSCHEDTSVMWGQWKEAMNP